GVVDIGEDLELVRHARVVPVGGEAVGDAPLAPLRFHERLDHARTAGFVADPAVAENRHALPIPERALASKGGRDLSPGEQAGVAAGGGGVDRGHALGGEADDVVRAAGLGARARQALAAEWLASHYRADLVAVDVEVA